VPGRTSRSPLPPLDLDELAATADRTAIPARALAAYASTALLLREEQPSCRITWVTLAGVGPMQVIPSTWARRGADGDGDGTADPQHPDDAALAAARYLCASGGDLTASSSSWGQAVLSSNRSEDHVRHVLSVANGYADRADAG
jgi:membrane-bound lytic murein transglycosylase B